jgi:hypothetical protein
VFHLDVLKVDLRDAHVTPSALPWVTVCRHGSPRAPAGVVVAAAASMRVALDKINREPNRKIRFLIRFLILRNRNNRIKFGSYSRVTELTEKTEVHELYFTYLYFVRLCLVYLWCFIFDLLHICVTILLLFSYQLLLLKINIVLHNFFLQHVYLLLS